MRSAKRTIFFLIAVFFILFAIVALSTNAKAIDEVVDNYSDSSKVNVTYQVIRNSTLEVMELNYTSTSFEDFTTFTEVDPAPQKITVDSAVKVSWLQMKRDSAHYVYKDYGAGYFDDFEHFLDANITDVEAGDVSSRRIMTPYILTMLENDVTDSIWFYIYQNVAVDDTFRFAFLQRDGGVNEFLWTSGIFGIGNYYFIFSRTGVTLRVKIYDDPARTNLIADSGNQAGVTEDYRFLHVVKSDSSVGDPNDHSSGYVENLKLANEDGYENTGYFTTTNFMDGLNENITVVLLNSTIPQGSINLEISENGLVWTDLGLLTSGYYSEDLRSLGFTDARFRFNFTRGPNPTLTQRVYQVRLIHEGAGVGPGPTVNVTGAWTEYNFTWIRTLTGTNASVGGNWLNQTYWLDDYQFNVTEVVGAPGYDIRFDISGLPDNLICLQIVGFMEYDGSAGHTFEVQAWNYTSSAWITVSDIPDTSKRWINGSIDCTSGDFIQNGLFQGRYYHPSPGNVNHHFCLDYGKLRAFAPFPVPSVVDRFFIGLFIGIALLIIAYLYNEHGR